jgi:dephospho-CoA kinase
MILRVGLTGGIASGKSTVARLLRERGCVVIDADEIVKALYQPGQAGYLRIVETYGSGILDSEGAIDRPKLSEAALATPQGALQLNALIHPLVIEEQQRILARLEQGDEDVIAVVEATLLLESGGRGRFDRIVVVDAEHDVQLKRGVGRGLTEAEVQRRMSRQLAREERLAAADYVIENHGSMSELAAATDELLQKLKRDLAEKSAL